MSLNSIFTSGYKEQRWVDQIRKIFTNEVSIDIIDDTRVCVFNVPKAISAFKPEAYVPHVIALGPYHHMDPHLYQMERYKLAIAKAILTPQQIHDFQGTFIDKLVALDPIIRGCYHKYLDLDNETLAWIVAIDGLFLLGLLRDYAGPRERMMGRSAILSRDLMVLENQLPFVILKEIRKALEKSSPNDHEDVELFSMMKGFCQAHSPLTLAPKSRYWPDTSHLHLLDLMYHLILNNCSTTKQGPNDEEERILKLEETTDRSGEVSEKCDVVCDNIGNILEVGMKFGIARKILKPVAVIRNLPWEKISNMLGLKIVRELDHDHDNSDDPQVQEITVPTVSSLHHYAGIKFRHTIGGIRDIKFVEEEATLYLPVITLDINSEVVLRNLVAYEQAVVSSHSNLEFAQYVDLISGIIDTVEDVKLLKEKGIIKGNLRNEEIADLFNGINRSSGNCCNKTVVKINRCYNKRPWVKIYRFVKKKVYSSWKIITILSTVLLLLLLILYSFCEFYDCHRYFTRD